MVACRSVVAALCLLSAASGVAVAQSKIDWPMYGFDSLHSGHNPSESILGQKTVSKLALAWSFSPGTFEQAIDPSVAPDNAKVLGQPIVAANVPFNGTSKDLVLIGDKNGYLFALDVYSSNPAGTVVWYRPLGVDQIANCGGKPETVGIRAAAAIDRSANNGNGAVYVAMNGIAYALDLATGSILPGWPVTIPTPVHTVTEGFIHDSPTVVNGKLYVGTSSDCNDKVPYYGRVVEIDTASATISNVWYTLSGNATPPAVAGGGVWGWGGVAVDPSANAGGVYVATGNARVGLNQQGFAEDIVNLSRDLSTVAGAAGPKLADGDYDYGLTPVVFQPDACPTKLVAALNKTGVLVVDAVNGDGTLSLKQSLQVQSTGEWIGNVAWDDHDQLVLVTAKSDGPAPFVHGLTALQVDAACATPLTFAWQTTKNMSGGELMPAGTRISPITVADRLAYFGVGGSTSVVYAVATQTSMHGQAGQVLWQSPPLSCQPDNTPVVVNGRLFVGCEGRHALLSVFAAPAQ